MEHPCEYTRYVRATGVSFRKMSDCMDDVPKKDKNPTEEGNSITVRVLLHEKHVAIEHMLTEVPREPTVKRLGNREEERRDRAGLDVSTDSSLC